MIKTTGAVGIALLICIISSDEWGWEWRAFTSSQSGRARLIHCEKRLIRGGLSRNERAQLRHEVIVAKCELCEGIVFYAVVNENLGWSQETATLSQAVEVANQLLKDLWDEPVAATAVP